MKTIVVAVDFSNATPGVLEMASELAKAFGAQLRLFHVVEPEPSYTAYGFTPDEFPFNGGVPSRNGKSLRAPGSRKSAGADSP